ncbi:MAG: hypothetical protein HY000_08320 [Planctomycetes bacterium]|nr:hypothetical protein [Planctomycetota bacterium]
MPDSNHASHIVADGHKRLLDALQADGTVARIRTEVENEFALHFPNASVWIRWRLRREINREIERRLAKLAPPDALY